MAKGDDAVRRRKNKVQRKRMSKGTSSSAVSSRIASIIAAKCRRKSGKRRICQGMCFSLPTPEDPFNDRYNKAVNKEKPKQVACQRANMAIPVTQNSDGLQETLLGHEIEMTEQQDFKKPKVVNWRNEKNKLLFSCSKKDQITMEKAGKAKVSHLGQLGVISAGRGLRESTTDCHSKFLILCLNAIQKAWMHDSTFDGDVDRPLMDNAWGAKFWEHCLAGLDILETSTACSSREQIAWLVSTAADIITGKEKEGLVIDCPFLLYLVPSQEEAIKVRSLCKPLKSLGIHAVSIHPGASVDHQVVGLKNCEPEFIVSTPERLLELVTMGTIDISCVSLLVLDGLQSLINGGFLETLKSIRQCISGDPQTVIFSDFYGSLSTSTVQDLLTGPICRLSLSDSVTSESVCISQSIYICNSEEEKTSKAIQVLNKACEKNRHSSLFRVVFITRTAAKAQTLTASLTALGFYIFDESLSDGVQGETSVCANHNSKKGTAISVMDKEQVGGCTDIGEFQLVLFIDFPSSIDDYVEVLTTMSRHSIYGELHSFLCQTDVPSASGLLKVLEQCAQPVPEFLKDFLDSSSMSEQ